MVKLSNCSQACESVLWLQSSSVQPRRDIPTLFTWVGLRLWIPTYIAATGDRFSGPHVASCCNADELKVEGSDSEKPDEFRACFCPKQ